MAFARARLPGFWTFNSAVSPSEFEHLDDYAYAIDGRGGGAYAPTSVITIGGSGLTVSGPFNASDAQIVDVAGSLTIKLGATLQTTGNQVVNSGAIVGFTNGSFLTVQSGATFTMNAGATCTLGANVTITTASRSYQRAEMFLQYNDFTYWAQDAAYFRSFPAVAAQLQASGTVFQIDNMVWEARVPDGSTIQTVSWTILPVVGPRGALPTLPRFWVEVIDVTTGAAAFSTAVVDSSASVAAYETLHTITSPVLGWAIDKTKHVVLVRCQGEAGGGFVALMQGFMPIVNYTRTKLAEE